ncbi:MAG: N-6 DNA methylase [Gammaproteobacteria bacterium]|nr:N-6 DNA methylase [Gammaproteobacteria bacterium]
MARRTPIDLGFEALRLEGGLFSAQHLARVAHEQAEHQREADYRIPAGLRIRDEIGRAFRIGQALWDSFSRQRERSDIAPMEASRAFVTALLQQAFGFVDLAAVPTREVNQGRFPIGHMARGNVPVVVAPHDLRLDDGDASFADTRRRSAFQLAQEYLNAADASLWAIVANGLTLRLLRDNASLTRPAYLEADLERLFSEERYADFSALWLIFHASRFPAPGQPPAECILERWRTAARLEGGRVLDRLRDGVTDALLVLGEGFLQHRANQPLRESLECGELTVEAYFQQLLRLVYRLIFWFTVEDRGVLHPQDADPAARATYAAGYASRSLRGRALRRAGADRHADQWQGVIIVFRALAHGEPRLGLPPLGGLFAADQGPRLDAAELPNTALLRAVKSLAWFRDGNALTRVNYRDMGPEELGSIYESLLELVPELSVARRAFDFVGLGEQTRGHARKLTGSYYTPDSLVQELLKSTLDPVLERALAARPQDPTGALLDLAVIDPACGSGHFLLAAARRIAERLTALRITDGNPTPDDYRHALREVIAHCIFGVDKNPLALELARTALWLEAVTPDVPLSFLDHHLVCGDALLGLVDFTPLTEGIPKEAYKPLTGDDRETYKALAAKNRAALKSLARIRAQRGLELMSLATRKALEQIDAGAGDTLAAIDAKRRAYAELVAQAEDNPLAQAADLYLAAFLVPKRAEVAVPTTADLVHTLYGHGPDDPERLAAARAHCRAVQVLHWPLAFAQVLGRGGFDVVLGNPPWERIKLQEEEFFANRSPEVAQAPNRARRHEAIAQLAAADPDSAERRLFEAFEQAKQQAEAASAFAHTPARYPLTGVGDVNTYALFAETASRLIAPAGRAGLVLPTGIATDDSTKAFFADVAQNGRLASLFDFENRAGIFPAVDSRQKFCLFVTGQAESVEFAFFLTDTAQVADGRRRFRLSPEDFARLNPNTRTCPVFRSRRDAEITKKIYGKVPILWQERLEDGQGRELQPEINGWGLRFQTLFHMSNDSHLFHDRPAADRMPLYEAKLIHQFDHRWATYQPGEDDKPESRDLTLTEKRDPACTIRPRYWVERREVFLRLSRLPKLLLDPIKSGSTERLTLALATLLFWPFVARQPGMDAARAHARLYPLWRSFVEQQPFARVLCCTQLGLCGDNPPLLQQTRQSQLPAAPIDRIVATERHSTAWYDTDPKLVEERLRDADGWGHWVADTPRVEDEEALWAYADRLLEASSPKWLMGWRDITNATNERTVIASVFPVAGVGNNLPLMLLGDAVSSGQAAAILGCLTSLILDFVARHKVGGTHLNFFIYKQLPVLPPDAYTQDNLDFIVPRVLELVYTAHDLRPFYDDLMAENPTWDRRTGPERGQPFPFNPERRALLRAELDAWYARLYGLTRDELRYLLDPADAEGPYYPSETFRVLKKNEIREHGEYRTQRLVLDAWDKLCEFREPRHADPSAH